jgi:8-oxo-dGTP pyrophosphatase MutT (NUDIX family)
MKSKCDSKITQTSKIMTQYVIGCYFTNNLKRVALILKNRPKWQAGKFNLPGGHVESNETLEIAISREFYEECAILTTGDEWIYIGEIDSSNNYNVAILLCVQKDNHSELKTNEDQPVIWCDVDKLPENIIPNLSWIIPYAIEYVTSMDLSGERILSITADYGSYENILAKSENSNF